jgi:sporadic carbohydrate cluster 2OG-Fe(II) oxygenase
MVAAISTNNSDFFSQGYAIVEADDKGCLDQLRSDIYQHMVDTFGVNSSQDPENGLNNFHNYIDSLTAVDVNSLRLDLIQKISSEINFSEMIYRAFEKNIKALLGPDILAQKGCNIVIQPPGDPNPSEVHRDAPLNSPYEIVVWVPFVDCYDTKAMYLLESDATEIALEYLKENSEDWDKFEEYCKSKAIRPSVPYGSALIFFTGLLHGSEINQEDETRVSINIRYKNLFAPSGLKNQLQFFKLLRNSPLSRLGSKLELKELLK